jgi:hypothetical protein
MSSSRQLEQQSANAQDRWGFLLERFHFSYYALLPEWDLYASFDARLAQLNCVTILLQIPEQDIADRCIDRKDRATTTWSDDIITYFGSRRAALEAVVRSTNRRREAAYRSRLPVLEIDTRAQLWEVYANKIVEVWKHGLPSVR